ncbi:DEAD/DEAH box helicase [Aminipila sp.]|uniref:DEAD/DEAH box helicase n=1 Tax=Aminipila sp. TaxID=2060095 RepID=UPI00289E3895|nr:DEAD/DEAH box helicase [Aminipila sp.]
MINHNITNITNQENRIIQIFEKKEPRKMNINSSKDDLKRKETNMNNNKISQKITTEEIATWKNKVVTITAPTGAGKSHFIKNNLYDYAKEKGERILMLIHRLNCIEQFQMELEKENKLDIIDIKTYQSNEYYRLPKDFDFNQYQYIVCDEFHYFLSDSNFNSKTEVSLKRILGAENATKIFLSATSKNMKNYITDILKVETVDYNFPYDYSFINKLTFYYSTDYIEKYIEKIIESGDKAIFFIQSATKGYELYKKYDKHTIYNCGKSDKHYKYVEKEKITNMLRNERFDEQILITTTCLEAGVNIKDTQLKHIVLDVEDIDVMLQCIGRKRIQGELDKVNLYIHTLNNQQLGGKITRLKNMLIPAQYLLHNGQNEYTNKYGREKRPNLTYSEVQDDRPIFKVNMVMLYKTMCDIGLYQKMIEKKYCKYISELFGNKKYSVEEKLVSYRELKLILEEFKNKKLFKAEKKLLINNINVRVSGRQQRSYRSLNQGLEWLGLPYIIIPKRTRHERFWIIEEIEDNNDDRIA